MTDTLWNTAEQAMVSWSIPTRLISRTMSSTRSSEQECNVSSDQSQDSLDNKHNDGTGVSEVGRLIVGPTGQPMFVKVDGQASRGATSLIEYSHAAGALGPPAHVHHSHEEAFYVLDGQLTLTIDREIVTLNPGEAPGSRLVAVSINQATSPTIPSGFF